MSTCACASVHCWEKPPEWPGQMCAPVQGGLSMQAMCKRHTGCVSNTHKLLDWAVLQEGPTAFQAATVWGSRQAMDAARIWRMHK